MKLRTYVLIAVLLAAVAAVVWYVTAPSSAPEEAVPPASRGGGRSSLAVRGWVVTPQSFVERITLTGSILANEAVVIRPEVSGRIVHIGFAEGERVRKGAVLVKLFDADLQARLQQTLSQVELDSESVHRLARIRQVDGISVEELQQAKATLAMRRAEADVIRAQIEKTVIAAPFDGIVGLRNVSEGAVVSPTTDVTLLKDDTRLKLECTVPEKYATQIATGTVMTFAVRGTSEDRTYTAHVYARDPELDPVSRTLRVRARIDNAEGLLPGMFADVDLELADLDDALLVPTESVIVDINGPKVFVTDGGAAREVRITTGTRTREHVRVINGLQPGDTVLTTGMLIMKSGMPIEVAVEQPADGPDKGAE